MNYKITTVLVLAFLSFGFIFNPNSKNIVKKANKQEVANIVYHSSESKISAMALEFQSFATENETFPSFEAFSKAFVGYSNLKNVGKIKNQILTLIDFSISANQERMWVIDMVTKKVLLHTLVAHGRNSGEEFATNFSNKAESFQSSLGFFTTGETYSGKHGLSLRLDGQEQGINGLARERAIVIHGADYVSEDFIKNNGRLGRSLGCPAVATTLAPKLIETIKNNSCLFLYYPKDNYFRSSKLTS